MEFTGGISCFCAVVDPADFLLTFPRLGCGDASVHAQKLISTDMCQSGTVAHFSMSPALRTLGSPELWYVSVQGCVGGCVVAALTPVIWLSPAGSSSSDPVH